MGMQLQERQHPVTAVSLTAVAAGVVAIASFIVNPLVALVAAAIALVCGVVAFVRHRNALGVVVLGIGLLPFVLALFLLFSLTGSTDGG